MGWYSVDLIMICGGMLSVYYLRTARKDMWYPERMLYSCGIVVGVIGLISLITRVSIYVNNI